MSETIQAKYCPDCKQTKPLSEFTKDRRKKDGLRSWCKACMKAYQQSDNGKAAQRKALAKYRRTSKGKAAQRKGTVKHNARNPNYAKATNAVNHAIRDGRLPRADTLQCHYCFRDAQQYHHWHGYEPEYWLDVVPTCLECHKKEHRKTA